MWRDPGTRTVPALQKLCSVVNIAPIHTRKAAIDSSHRDLCVAIFKPNFCFQLQLAMCPCINEYCFTASS